MDIPHTLKEQIREGKVVLFLGSGATIGASHPANLSAPDGRQLAEALADKFLGAPYRTRSLDQVARLAISETDLTTVQTFVASLFMDFQPADFHKLIPDFVWPMIATTNYDLIIERAFNAKPHPLQRPVPFFKNGQHVEDALQDEGSFPLLKLHGCITNITDPDTPLVLTPEQYATHRRGRSRLFERLESQAHERTILFVGQSLSDPDLLAILDILDALGQAKPRSYVVAPAISDVDERYWANRKLTSLRGTLRDFLTTLDAQIPRPFRGLAAVPAGPISRDPICKLFTKNEEPSKSLHAFLRNEVDFLHPAMTTSAPRAQDYYRGHSQGWSAIQAGFDVRRSICDTMLTEIILPDESERISKQTLYLLKGHAGSGKSIALQRVAWSAATEFEALCLFAKEAATVRYEPISELASLTKRRIFLFIDPASDYRETIRMLIRRAQADKILLTVITAERDNEWNSYCDSLDALLTESYDLPYLDDREIRDLLVLLEKHKSLGSLENRTQPDRVAAFAKLAGRQLLVALHEATIGKPFRDIILDEYNSLSSDDARIVYRTVAVLHRLGVLTRAGLISRVHGIAFDAFRERLFKPLEHVVFASQTDQTKDHVYRTRHPHIAEILFESALANPEERLDEYMRIISALDVDYQPDREGLLGLLRAKDLVRLFPASQMIRRLYAVGIERAPDLAPLFQQTAIFEMNAGDLDKAAELLRRGKELAPRNSSIAHSMAELSLRRAERAHSPLEKAKHRSEARQVAQALVSRDRRSSYPYHTMIKSQIDEFSEIPPDATESIVTAKIREIEALFARASQAVPDDPFLLEAEANFCNLLKRKPQQVTALRRAFALDKHNAYVALRLARVCADAGEVDEAIKVLRECLDANPLDKDVSFRLAMILRDGTRGTSTEIRHLLRNAFTASDSRYEAQFWFAVYEFMDGDKSIAKEIFRTLADAPMEGRSTVTPRAPIGHPTPVRFSGVVERVEASYGYIVRDGDKERIFAHRSGSDAGIWSELAKNARMTFVTAFNYRGPIALDLRSE